MKKYSRLLQLFVAFHETLTIYKSMLIKFSVKNYRSIRDEVVLDFIPKKFISDPIDNSFATGISEVPYLHRIAAIYGVNGSGKTNILRALDAMRGLILSSAKNHSEGDEIPIEPFELDVVSRVNPTEFMLEFIVAQVRYIYAFSATPERVVSESLYAFPNGVKQLWFERKWIFEAKKYDWKFGSSFKGDKNDTKTKTLENVLYFSKAVMDNNELLKPLNEYIRRRLYVNPNNGFEEDVVHEMMYGSEEAKGLVMSLIKAADLDIDDIIVQKKEIAIDSVPKEFREQIKNSPTFYRAYSVHKIPGTEESVMFDLEDQESIGTNKFFHLAGMIVTALKRGSFLAVDELETSLHCKLMSFILDIFNDPKRNTHGSQLLFTTHSPIALDHDDFRRDQIWFTNKTAEEKSTILYSLAEFSKFHPNEKPVRKGQSVSKGILEGRFYTPPKPNIEQFDLFENALA